MSFLTEVSSFYNVEMPMDYPIIAPFYSDIDTRTTGQVEDSSILLLRYRYQDNRTGRGQ